MPQFPDAALPALPDDAAGAALAGRVWRPDVAGPSVVAIRDGAAIDVTHAFPTMRDLCETPDPAVALRAASGETLGSFEAILCNTPPDTRDRAKPWLLAPIDLQAIKAAGVTFAISMLERVIEERARGDLTAAAAIRAEVTSLVGDDLARLKPGSPEAMRLKQVLIEQGAWSQYLEVGIGPDAEIFTKAQPMAAVGTAADAGIHPASSWNNPEPEMVLAVASTGRIVGATLGNDVNLRDVEGRSALLLSKAKDNNASCAIGPDGAGGVVVLRLAQQQRGPSLHVPQVHVVAQGGADDAASGGDRQHHLRLRVVPGGRRVDAGIRGSADRGHRLRLGEDLGVGADADFQVLAPGALL